MGFLEGKSPAEKKKMIAAGALGLVSLIALYLAFGRGFFSSGSSTSAKTTTSPTPKPNAAPNTASTDNKFKLPDKQQQTFEDETTAIPVLYRAGSVGVPDAGRNIFAFYEPPVPCNPNKPGDCPPTPTPKPPPPTPTPTVEPTPEYYLASANPSMVYAGSKAFKLELSGGRFTPDAQVYFSQQQLKTTFVSDGRLSAEVPANLIAQEGPRQIIVQSTDGTKRSGQVMITLQAPPKPTFQFIGAIGRKRGNNDTAYFVDPSRQNLTFGARLNDVVNGRFRLIDISPTETVFEDVNLGFKHKVLVTKTQTATGSPGQPNRGFDSGFTPFPGGNVPPGTQMPGIPNNFPQYVPPQPPPQPQPTQPSKDDGNN